MTTQDGARQTPLAERLADFPWDQISSYREQAGAHPDGLVNLSMGTPVDPTPEVVRSALCAAAEAAGYPTTLGQPALRQAAADWMSRRWGVTGVTAGDVLPLIGTKELLSWLPTVLEVAPTSAVAVPDLAYPSYVAAANIAGARISYAEDPTTIDPRTDVRLCYINYPNNPTGRVATVEELRRVVEWARARDVVLVSDECYLEFTWSREPVSILHPEVCGGSFDNLLSVHSLSKRSNMAGYRSGFFTGDPVLMSRLLQIRKHLGVAMPSPIQAASIAALGDDEHVDAQRARYRRRRDVLSGALRAAGWNVPDCQGGIFLWIDRPGLTSWESVSLLADQGILATPGDFYGPAGAKYVRVALTALDERVDSAAHRLHALA